MKISLKRIIPSVAVALFISFNIAAQDYTLSGYMRDDSTGDRQ